jgi:hypothetical protein
MNPISITNEQVLAFYRENPSIDITAMNLIFIDILKQLSTNLSATIGNTISSQILSIVSEIKIDIQKLNSSMTIQLHDIKKEYMDDIKLVLNNTESNSQEKISRNLDKSMENLVSKINEIIPKNQQHAYTQIEQCIKTHCATISQTTTKILEIRERDTNDDELIENIEKSVSATMTSLQQSIFSSLQQVNEKITIQKQVQDTLHNELSSFLNKYKNNSSIKGAVSETELYYMLQNIAPSDEIIRCSGESNTCDIRLNRKNRALPSILFENKDYTASVNSDEVAKFQRDLQIQSCHGIFISQNSPIIFKEMYHIDIINGLIHIYIPNANYDIEKLKVAIHVIDNLSERLAFINDTDGQCVKFSQDDFEGLKDEYKKFAIKKNDMIEMIRTITKQLIDKLEDIQLPVLKRLTGNMETTGIGILCTSCNNFWAKNKASLSAHMKKCNK